MFTRTEELVYWDWTENCVGENRQNDTDAEKGALVYGAMMMFPTALSALTEGWFDRVLWVLVLNGQRRRYTIKDYVNRMTRPFLRAYREGEYEDSPFITNQLYEMVVAYRKKTRGLIAGKYLDVGHWVHHGSSLDRCVMEMKRMLKDRLSDSTAVFLAKEEDGWLTLNEVVSRIRQSGCPVRVDAYRLRKALHVGLRLPGGGVLPIKSRTLRDPNTKRSVPRVCWESFQQDLDMIIRRYGYEVLEQLTKD